ncbi:MAG: hypothetical protein QW244_00840 [Candidatus Pacearchaeota archaeon]
MQENEGTVWISTVIYILISLAVISSLLIAVRPKIEEARDRYTINYMVNVFQSLNSLVYDINEVQGTRRVFEIKITKGEMKIIPEKDRIEWQITTRFKFSEPGQEVKIGDVGVITLENRGKIDTFLFLNYTTPINLTTVSDNEGDNLTLTQSPTPYKLLIENKGAPATSVNNTIFISKL